MCLFVLSVGEGIILVRTNIPNNNAFRELYDFNI